MWLVFILSLFLQNRVYTQNIQRGDLIGCYKDGIEFIHINNYKNDCFTACIERDNYRYSIINTERKECGCTNFLGVNYTQGPCSNTACYECKIYYTGNFAPTPVTNLTIENVTDTSAYISWNQPNFFIDIDKYQVKVNVIKTYASYLANPQWWSFTNNTFLAELGSLNPGSVYNVTVQAISTLGEGDIASAIMETQIGDPDNIPLLPEVIKEEGSKKVIALDLVMNNNGPVTSYYVIVINKDSKQFFEPDSLKSYKESIDEGIGYYIAAEIGPDKAPEHFTVGDGKQYGRFYNAPLDPNAHYLILEGVLSKSGNITKIVYSNINKIQRNKDRDERSVDDSHSVTTALTISLFLLIAVLSSGVAFFIYIRNKHLKSRIKQLRNNQELAMQGPILEVVNEGYIPEDEIAPLDYYTELREKVWRIPQNLINVDITNMLGVGQFGCIYSGSVKNGGNSTPIINYIIHDKKLSDTNKENMLRDLDLLIKTDKHRNVIEFIGLCENVDTLYVILESTQTNLKNLLLGSRDTSNNHFSSISELQAVSFMIDIGNGLEHLEKQKILHKQLCARNIQITSTYVAKISGYGLAQYNHRNMVPDYTRWTAVEVFRDFPFTFKSMVWSFACIMWEISVLGGTPYGSIPNNEIPDKIKGGLRLPQLPYIDNDLYQIMLDCWQSNPSERPRYSDILDALIINQNNMVKLLNFNMYPGFQYEQFYTDSELVARLLPVL